MSSPLNPTNDLAAVGPLLSTPLPAPWLLPSPCPHPPAVVVGAQPPLSVRVLDGVVRVLKGLVPVEAGLPGFAPRRPVLEATVVLAVGSIALWTDTRGRCAKTQDKTRHG